MNLLELLGGDVPETFDLGKHQSDALRDKVRQKFPGLLDTDNLDRFLELDLQIIDADAYDLIFSRKEDIFGFVYNDDLEVQIRQPDATVKPKLEALLAVAVLGVV